MHLHSSQRPLFTYSPFIFARKPIKHPTNSWIPRLRPRIQLSNFTTHLSMAIFLAIFHLHSLESVHWWHCIFHSGHQTDTQKIHIWIRVFHACARFHVKLCRILCVWIISEINLYASLSLSSLFFNIFNIFFRFGSPFWITTI